MKKFIEFFKDSYEELRERVTWPTYKELQSHATLVLIASFIFALVIGGIDFVFDNILGWLYKNF
jgi:preprotein translocase subunit SecE